MLNQQLQPQIVNALRTSVLFQGMTEAEFNQVLSFAELQHLAADHLICQQDAPLNAIYFVYNGAVKLVRSTIKGDEKIIEVVLNGRTFAEGVLFSGAPKYPVSAVAIKSTTLISIQAKPFLELLKNSSELCINMLGHLSVRLHWMVKELDKQTLHNASFRVIDYFLSHVNELVDQEFELVLPISKRDIASRLSVKPETFSRVLKSLETKSLIQVREKTIIMKNVAALRDILSNEAL